MEPPLAGSRVRYNLPCGSMPGSLDPLCGNWSQYTEFELRVSSLCRLLAQKVPLAFLRIGGLTRRVWHDRSRLALRIASSRATRNHEGFPAGDRASIIASLIAIRGGCSLPHNSRLQRTRPANLPHRQCVTIARRGPRR
jgi:hypothetical protein